eukprot:gene13836-29431_t
MEPDARKKSGRISTEVVFGLSQIPHAKDEDRYAIDSPSQLADGTTISSLGVFDGHGGSYASSACANTLNRRIISHYNMKIDNDSEEFSETILCEAIKEATTKIDAEVKDFSVAGTTAVTIYVIPECDGIHRVICQWVGDSRCVMFQNCRETGKPRSVMMSQDHKPTLLRERMRIQKQWKVIPLGVNRPLEAHSQIFRSIKSSKMVPTDERPMEDRTSDMLKIGVQTKKTITSSRTTSTSTSVSNTPNSNRNFEESNMITDNNNIINTRTTTDNNNNNNNNNEVVTPNRSIKTAAANDTNNTNDIVTPTRRKGRGPFAVYNKHGNISLTMTRSIGDRLGPASCIPVPDITGITIPANQHARFVLASDGIWDVLSVEQVQAIALRCKDAGKAAHKIARLAWTKRLHEVGHMDDITVLVVDVNPSAFLSPWDGYMPRCTIS